MTAGFPLSVWMIILAATILSMAVVLTFHSTRLSPNAKMILTGLALIVVLYAGVFAASYVLAQKSLPAEKEAP